ncbi:hypothetical protein ATZ35_14850 [Enterococcus rotai]|uniref:Uncharacterized protein n=1 Tax=Enterococcus rotai TaxID=118060 RepID=A0A0U2VLI8_9ENTE|nr:hypothetical protein ATZ35_14850 [Enterococcus rotai]
MLIRTFSFLHLLNVKIGWVNSNQSKRSITNITTTMLLFFCGGILDHIDLGEASGYNQTKRQFNKNKKNPPIS